MSELITSINHGAICEITLNRIDKHNALNSEMIVTLTHAIRLANQDPKVRIIKLLATGKSFCAGADLHGMKQMATFSKAENIADAKQLANLFETLNSSSKATLAVTHGAIYGGGCGLVASCDVVIANSNSVFCFSEAKLGLIPAVISPYVAQRLTISHMRRFFITAEKIAATVAKQINLVDEVADSDKLTEITDDYCRHILTSGPHAVMLIKQLVRANQTIDDWPKLQDYTIHAIANCRVSKEAQDGLTAFFNQQQPKWVVDN